ncbi:hypothetical protein AXF42_Ash001388 [Apostasia shenzhenica]|uniref:peptidylprolyl isomerase n=1 Tax=Apostasia shenzhenica TaxID=1088818 RepID=A0A2I0AUS2_9ASPA|nr:hypothetical protein AXF42_Ash001388 [Apostasia shenzhenica]
MKMIAVKTFFVNWNAVLTTQRQNFEFSTSVLLPQRKHLAICITNDSQQNFPSSYRSFPAFCVASQQGVENVDMATNFKDFRVTAYVDRESEIKVRVDVSGARTQQVFDDVFSKLIDAAQPIPGFKRVKGGKTPDIPKDVLLQIIGASKVNKETILKIINSTVAEYVAKEGLKVTRDLRVEQSYDEIEDSFIPGREFCFEAIIQFHFLF